MSMRTEENLKKEQEYKIINDGSRYVFVDQFSSLTPEQDKLLTALIMSQLPKGYKEKKK